ELIIYNQALTPHHIKFNVPEFGYSRCLIPYAPNQFMVATDLGLFLLDTLSPTAPARQIYDHLVYSVLPGNKSGEFWFSTDFGLYRLDADFHFKRYAIESGLQESEFNTNSCFKSESGKLYFGGINGITAFYPSQIKKEEDKPLPYISVLSINGKVRERYIAPGTAPTYTLAYDENVIQLRLLGKGQRSPGRYNFQYMVKGLHEDWINLGRNMDIQLQLPPGDYTIYYHIADSFEPHAETLHALQLLIKPPLYKRWWFVAVLSMIPLYFLYYIMDLRRKRLALRLAYAKELEHKLFEDRMRISRDLHDNIGAQMATVKRGINFILDQGDRLTVDQTTNKMRDLEAISTQINQELRDTIWAVQQEQIDVAGFITRLKNYIFQLLGPDSPYRVIYEEQGDKHLILGPFVALNLHRISQEAINNILKHAEATEIRIIVDSRNSSLKIQITDNGKGFDPEKISEGYGLGNIRKRAEQIGAEVYINRLKTEGSSIEISIEKLFTTSQPK
ncbi:MAG: sensor histidine kinase, partial [Saprospiraceae bacterium]|nr:sensor histidine kinase [Saprospiraceae bacterium]